MTINIQFLQEQLQECEICGRRIDGNQHRMSCPYYRLNRLLESRREIRCPFCQKTAVESNKKKNLECQICRRIFATGVRVPGIDTATLERIGLDDWKQSNRIRAYLMPMRGDGKFPVEVCIYAAAVAVNETRMKRNLPPAFESIVPGTPGDKLPPETLSRVLRQAGLK